MNKSAIQKFAIQARTDLLTQVKQQAYNYGIDENGFGDENATTINGVVLPNEKVSQRKALIGKIKQDGYEKVMDTVAYTWFNRFIALRYMEVNDFLPSRVRVFSNDKGEFKPEIITRALELEIDGLNRNKVIELKSDPTKEEDLYRYLLITQCNALNNELPEMFEKMGSYTELLLPARILSDESVIAHLVNDIDEEDFKEAVEIIGWLFQYYNEERKNEVINIYKGTVKKEDIPSATQLFTTAWVVRYMVDNSLGRYWIERNPNSGLKSKLEFFATPKNDEIKFVDEKISPEELTFFDPCMGSGHILVYAFEVLMEIYKECGYSERESASLIVEKNLFGIDIDDRAYQLAYFAVMMKARSYDRRFLSRDIEPNVMSIQETNNLTRVNYSEWKIQVDDNTKNSVNSIYELFKDAKEIGALLTVKGIDFSLVEKFIDNAKDFSLSNLDVNNWYQENSVILPTLIKQGKILSNKYNIVCTNPPYLNKMEGQLKTFVTKEYKPYCTDLFSVFMYRNFEFCKKDGYSAFMTPFVWMFIKSYENLRKYIIDNKSITSLIQMEYSAFEEATVPICAFVLKNGIEKEKGLYFRLEDFRGGMDVQKIKVLEALENKECGYFYESSQENFSKIPGSPIAYWVSKDILKTFKNKELSEFSKCKSGIMTGDDKFIKHWFELDINNISFNCRSYKDMSDSKWFPLNSGGGFRKWYGNNEKVVDLWNDGFNIKNNVKNYRLRDKKLYFKKGITWGRITSSQIAFREVIDGSLFGDAGPIAFVEDNRKYILGFLCSKVVSTLLEAKNPTLNFQISDIMSLPLIFDVEKTDIEQCVEESVIISKTDWDSFETSWDFEKHPLIKYMQYNALWGDPTLQDFKNNGSIELSYGNWSSSCEIYFNQLKANEEELNRIFIDIYGLQDELKPEIEDKDIKLHIADKEVDIKSFISYAVGCMFGRYSLDVDGLAFAGGDFDNSKYTTFIPDKDNVIPICDDEYFGDDIVNRFVEFVKVVYGADTLEENLDFIADALNKKGATSREIIRTYFLNDFYKDHVKTYQKRPIYWLFDSGKKNGFKALIYMHRYQKDLLAKVRTDYVHEQQERYNTQLANIESELIGASQGEKAKLNKLQAKFKDQALEIRQYEEKIKHLADQQIEIDLDDGVVKNYALFGDVLAKIK